MQVSTHLMMPCLLMLAIRSAPAGDESPCAVAWTSFARLADESYAGTPYLWLGKTSIELMIETPVQPKRALDLLWGAKGDQRGASIVVNGKPVSLEAGGYQGFRWQRVKLPSDLTGDRYKIVLKAAAPKAAFLAGVRLVPESMPVETQTEVTTTSPTAIHVRHGLPAAPVVNGTVVPTFDDLPPLERNAAQANQALKQCRKYVDGWLQHADPTTGLIPRNLTRDKDIWNGKDSAADNYPFMVMTCALTDRDMYNGRMRQMLETETRLTSRIGNLVDVFSFTKQDFHYAEPSLDRIIFDSSEYVKDGLMPLTELLGHTPWTDRMLGITNDIIARAPLESPFGKLPSDSVEVNGEMMQMLGRQYWMTGDERYLTMGTRIADYYLLGDHHPTRQLNRLRLDDHSCELISGLTEIYVTCHFAEPKKAEAYREPIHAMLDRILEVGLNEDGFMYDTIDPVSGKVVKEALTDNWGYDYNGFYAVYLIDREERYRDAVIRALRSLNKPKYLVYPWEGFGSDGISDCVEGALNLYNREPVEGVDRWMDTNIVRMLSIQKSDGVIEGWHGDGNFARTAIMWVLWKQQGATIQPWRPDVLLGALPRPNGIELLLSCQDAWSGTLTFDTQRHKTIMHMPLDYPRINQFPEWFTVADETTYEVAIGSEKRNETGVTLSDGLPIELRAGQLKRIVVTPSQ